MSEDRSYLLDDRVVTVEGGIDGAGIAGALDVVDCLIVRVQGIDTQTTKLTQILA